MVSADVTRSVQLRAVEFSPDTDCFALVFAEGEGRTHRMELPIWAAHQLARLLPRVGVPVPAQVVRCMDASGG